MSKKLRNLNVTVLGSGSFGTALAHSLSDNEGVLVTLWGNSEEILTEIKEQKTNKAYLGDIELSDKIKVSSDMKEVLKEADVVLIVVPSQAVKNVVELAKPSLKETTILVNCAKGLDLQTHLPLSRMIKSICPNNPFVAFSGPSHAEEVALKYPTSIVVASEEIKYAELIQSFFSSDHLRLYTTNDVTGVEMGGVLKNIIALAAGISNGLGYGDNTKSALITRGLLEMVRFGTAFEAHKETFYGLTGIGDLVVTATSTLSRNFTFGTKLGEGKSFDEAFKEMSMVVEGVYATKAIFHLAKDKNIDMPITEAVYNILYDGMNAQETVKNLMRREHRSEKGS